MIWTALSTMSLPVSPAGAAAAPRRAGDHLRSTPPLALPTPLLPAVHHHRRKLRFLPPLAASAKNPADVSLSGAKKPTSTSGSSSSSGEISNSDLAAITAGQQAALLSRQRHWCDAHQLFDRLRALPDYAPNPFHYNILLRHLARACRWPELSLVWRRMAADSVPASNTTYATLADAFAKAGLFQESLLWLRHMKSRAVAPDEVTMNTFVRILKGSGRYADAHTFFKNWCHGKFDIDFLGLDYSILDVTAPMKSLLADMFRTGFCPPVPDIVAAAADIKEMPRKPNLAATYNTVIDLYGKARRLRDATDTFADMLASGLMPDKFTFNTMINVCASHRKLEEAEALFGKMAEWRVSQDTKTFNVMMTMYASIGNLKGVLKYFRKIGKANLCPDAVSYRIVLQALCKRKMVQEVQEVIKGISKSGTSIDGQSLPVVMKMYVDLGLLDEANAFFEKHCGGGGLSSKIYAAIIDVYAEKGLWKEAEHVFYSEREMDHGKEIVEYNVMVKAYGLAKQYDRVSPLLQSMRKSGVSPDECTFNSLIHMFSVGGFPMRARKLLERMKDAGFRPNCKTYCAVIQSYSRNSSATEAVDMYNEMKALGIKPNEVVYGSLVDMFAEAGRLEDAVHYSKLMEESGIAPNQVVLTSLIKAYSKVNCWKEAQNLYTRMKSVHGGPDIMASNCMLNLYAKLGMVTEAKAIFDSLRGEGRADGVSYTTMMYLYNNMSMLDQSIDIAHELRKSGLLSDCASYNSIMASYAANGKLGDCAELLLQMVERNISPDAATFKMIFTILKKGGVSPEEVLQLEYAYNCGNVSAKQAVVASLFSMVGMHRAAIELCEQFLKPEVVIDSCEYNVAIKVCAASGEVDKALNLFTRMQDEGVVTDVVTCMHLVACYRNAGMVEGLRRIHRVLKYNNVEPSKSLYEAFYSAYRKLGRHDLAASVYQEMRSSADSGRLDYSSKKACLTDNSESEVEITDGSKRRVDLVDNSEDELD